MKLIKYCTHKIKKKNLRICMQMTYPTDVRKIFFPVLKGGKGESLTIRCSRLPLAMFSWRNFSAKRRRSRSHRKGINTASPNESFLYPVSGHILISFSSQPGSNKSRPFLPTATFRFRRAAFRYFSIFLSEHLI